MTPTMTPAALEAMLRREFPELDLSRLSVESVAPWEVVLRRRILHRDLRAGGTVMGPTLMSVADTSAYLVIRAHLPPDRTGLTSHLSIDFLRRPGTADLRVHARLLKLGRRTATCAVEIFSEGLDRPVAHATVGYALMAGVDGAPRT